MSHDVFISYSNKDKSTADAVCFALESKHIRCWIAPRDILPGVNWGESIIDAIAPAKVMVLIFSSHSNRSEQVMRELERAVNKGLPILPFRIEDVPLSKAFEYYISTRHWMDALTPPLEAHLRKLTRTVEQLLSSDGKDDSEAPNSAGSGQQVERISFESALNKPELLVGLRVGAFLLQEPIGSGGSGVVFRAWNAALAREACVKVFRPMRADFAGLSATIARSVRALAAIDHPNVIRVFDFGPFSLDDASSFYLATELVKGTTLEDWSRTLSADDSAVTKRLGLALSLAQALEAAHSCRYVDDVGFEQVGLLHGDIKPTNVLVRPDNSAVLLDFMMADVQRLLDLKVLPPSGLPGVNRMTTAAFGTPGFMAPEQEERGIVTVKTDIYSLGVTFCSLFAPDTPNPVGTLMGSDEPRVSDLLPLLVSMLSDEPESRPEMQTIISKLKIAIEMGSIFDTLEPEKSRQAASTHQPHNSVWRRLFSRFR